MNKPKCSKCGNETWFVKCKKCGFVEGASNQVNTQVRLPNIPDTDKIKEGTQLRIDKVFEFMHKSDTPKITSGIVMAVLEAYKHFLEQKAI